MTSCLFCQLVAGEIDSDIVLEEDDVVAFRDIAPQAPVHLLIVPRRHIASLRETQPDDRDLLGKLLLAAARLARQEGIDERGYRVIINAGADGGQTVDHLHVHLLGGRDMGWPPG